MVTSYILINMIIIFMAAHTLLRT